MTLAAASGLIAATAPFATTPSSAPLRAYDVTASASDARAAQSPAILHAVGFVEFDWSPANGTLPGFGHLPATGDSGARR
jgi:hypothetical protein